MCSSWSSESISIAMAKVYFFANRAANEVDFRITFIDGTGVGAGYTAQLYVGPAGSSLDALVPVFPTTTFRTVTPQAMGYVVSREVVIPNIPPGVFATVQMRAFNGSTWESSLCRGESNLIEVNLSGGPALPPSALYGMEPFQVVCIPEPGPADLLACGVAGWIAFGRRGRRSRSSQPQSAGTLVPP
jgi:hypothetical protein